MDGQYDFRRGTKLAATLFLAVIIVIIGCRKESPAVSAVPAPQTPRIVCFSPALTQMLADLGLAETVVGVGEIDPVAPPHAAPVGHFRQIDYEKLLALSPTHLVLQDTAREPLTNKFRELADRHGWKVHRFKLETKGDVFTALRGLGEAVGEAEKAAALADKAKRRMEAVAALTASPKPPRVLLAVSVEPRVMAAAKGTFLDEILQTAGGENALADSAVLYPELDTEKILSLAPDVVVYIHSHKSSQPVRLPESVKARVVELQDPAALLPSTSMPRIAIELAKLLHPDLRKKLDGVTRE